MALTWPDTAHPGDGNHVADHNLLATNGAALESRVIDLEALPAAALSTDAGQQATLGTDDRILVAGLAAAADLGTAAALDAPATGNAGATEVVLGSDTRLSDARTPTAHAHAQSDVTGLADSLAGKAASTHTHAPSDVTGTAVITTDPRLSDARTPTAHTHAPADITGTAVITTDSRLSDARTPTAHKASHATGGSDALTAADIGAAWQATKSGRWTSPAVGSMTTVAMLADVAYGSLYPVTVAHTLDRIGVQITASGSAGAVIRLGIYRAAENGADFTLVSDCGTIDGTQAAGYYAISISQQMTPGLYWLCAIAQGGASTRPTITASAASIGMASLLTGPTQVETSNNAAGSRVTGVTGALSGFASVTPSRYGIAALISVRIA